LPALRSSSTCYGGSWDERNGRTVFGNGRRLFASGDDAARGGTCQLRLWSGPPHATVRIGTAELPRPPRGPNASGKTTLLRLLSGVLRPLAGRVELDGAEVSRLEPRTRARRIAVVQQESPLVFPLRAVEYVLQGRYPYSRRLHFPSEDDLELVLRALEQVGGSHLGERWMNELSGGEKQRVVLARALAQQPLLLLLDEPTLHLDIGGQVELLKQLASLAATGHAAIVVVTHELSLAAEFADQVVLLQHGRSLGVGRPSEVLQEAVLREVFGAPLRVEPGPGDRPRIRLEVRPE
jgi:iron complex transport system ATP-binding protein